ncbi:hypothetical protein ARAM_002091 [Aspergillus rambellii]|uniref:Uncharacterized protein n=1 Tax=Aspergillus rambellii TaxID=308745 RepID=A0A0F8UE34_9EURO|nr:hypothetical protein ARAM_002091 [Aspergillus rambellii]
MSLSKAETDIILNKANIALARSQRLVASWLPAPTTEEQGNTKSDEELQREEDEIFTAVPETLGVGAPLPTKAADGSWNRAVETDSNDKLRKQLLGRNYKKVMAAKVAQAGKPASSATKPGVKTVGSRRNGGGNNNDDDDDDDDDDEGRTASIGKKRTANKRKQNVSGIASETDAAGNDANRDGENDGDAEERVSSQQGGPSARPGSGPKGRKKATSFLDEILAERSKKRKKR